MRSGSLHGGRARRLGAALVTTAVSMLCLSGLAHGAEKAVSTDLAWGIPSSEFAPTGQAISDVGASWVRLEFRWSEAEPSKGSYDSSILARYDRAVDTARAAGAKVLVFVNRAPRWASGSRNPMIGIWLVPEHRGRGIGTRAQAALVDLFFRHTPSNRVEAHTDVENLAEQRALEKVGMTREGTTRGAQWRNGCYRDGHLYAVLRAEWPA